MENNNNAARSLCVCRIVAIDVVVDDDVCIRGKFPQKQTQTFTFKKECFFLPLHIVVLCVYAWDVLRFAFCTHNPNGNKKEKEKY